MRYISLILSLFAFSVSGLNAQVFGLKQQSQAYVEATKFSSMDVEFYDFDQDSDLDVVVACEFCANYLLLNDGEGNFMPFYAFDSLLNDSEDIALADFDKDGFKDVFFVSEDSRINEFYWGGANLTFVRDEKMSQTRGISNAVDTGDINGDGLIDIVIGNDGFNKIFINQGKRNFKEAFFDFLDYHEDITQDVELADFDNDGDLDLLVGNEDANRLLEFNNGKFEVFEIPLRQFEGEETREAEFVDINNDRKLDIFFINVNFNQKSNWSNRVLIQNESGGFEDKTKAFLADSVNQFHSVDAAFTDLNNDGFNDMVITNAFGGPHQIFINQSGNYLKDDTLNSLGLVKATTNGIDVECADLNGDGKDDIYISIFRGPDLVYLYTNE